MKPKLRYYRGVWECKIPKIRQGSFGFGHSPSEAWEMYMKQQGNPCKKSSA